ncbi:MAG: hypothetical protein IID28_12940 [Planctomycetes bacterium]|nr:hypothetical protein [Planctomycetota bacterium]
MPRTERPPRRLLKKALIAVGGVVSVLVLLAMLAPTILSSGPGRAAIRGAIQQRLDGTVALTGLDLGWFGPQSVTGFAVNAPDGVTAMDLDLTVNAGLFELLTGDVEAITVDLSGTIRGELRPDGSTTFANLFARSRAPHTPRAPQARPGDIDEPFSLAGVPPVTLRLGGLSVTLAEQGSSREYGLDDLHGELSYAPGEPVKLDLAADVTGAATPGSVTVTGQVAGLVDPDGVLTPGGASGRIDVRLRNVPVPLTDRPTEIRSLVLAVTSDDLTERIELVVKADAVIDGTESGMLEATLAIDDPVDADGSVNVRLERIRGHLVGRAVPTALLQGFLGGTPIVATRDIGPAIDIDADFSGGATRQVAVRIRAEAVEIDFDGTVDAARRLDAARLHIAVAVHPELVLAITGLAIDRAADLVVDFDRLIVPPTDTPHWARDLAASGTVTLRQPVSVSMGTNESGVLLEGLELSVDMPSLGEGVTLGGSATLGGAETTLALTVRDILDEDASPALDGINASGVVSIRNIRPADVVALVPPEHAELVRAALVGPVAVTVEATFGGGQLHADLRVEGDGLAAHGTATFGDETIHVAWAAASLEVSPELAAAMQRGVERPVALVSPVVTTLELEPFDFAWPLIEGAETPSPIRGRIAFQEATLRQVPGLVEPLGIRDMEIAVTATGGPAPSITLAGTALLRRVATDIDLTALSYAATATFGDTMTVDGVSIGLRNLAVGSLDAITGGRAGDGLLEFVGATGNVVVTVSHVSTDAVRATVGVEFPYLAGDFTADLADETVSITTDNTRITLPRAALQKRLGTTAGPSPQTTVVADVPMTLAIRALRVPLAMLAGEPFDGDAVDIDLELRGGPLVLDDAKIGRNSIKDLRITLTGSDLEAGLTAKVTGLVEFAGAAEPGRIELTGTVTDLMADGVLALPQATLAMIAKVNRLHTAVIDGLADMQGLLVAALGPRVDAVATASNFSRNSGVLEARFETSNGWLDGIVYGANNAVSIKADQPVLAELELTPPLRDRLLYKIHPLLADIRTTEQPVRVTIGESSIPLDGDVSRLDALLEITIGRVEIDRGSTALILLTLANASNAKTISGEIEPIKVRIRKGVVTYERFAVKLDKFTMIYSGSIDLNTRYVNLTAEVPLDSLAGTFHELEGLTDDVSVPILYRGPFGNVKAEIEPEFLAEAAATIGVRAGIDELEKKTGLPIGDILDSIFGKKKKKKK